MCDKLKLGLDLLRDYKPELVMFLGFFASAVLYHDMREYMGAQTGSLIEMNMRLERIEHALPGIPPGRGHEAALFAPGAARSNENTTDKH